jgi:hypothetical protein
MKEKSRPISDAFSVFKVKRSTIFSSRKWRQFVENGVVMLNSRAVFNCRPSPLASDDVTGCRERGLLFWVDWCGAQISLVKSRVHTDVVSHIHPLYYRDNYVLAVIITWQTFTLPYIISSYTAVGHLRYKIETLFFGKRVGNVTLNFG